MSYYAKTVLEALEKLSAYPKLSEYVKTFDEEYGFMFTVETNPTRIGYQKQLQMLLNPNDMHSGSSWGALLRGVQAVMNGNLSVDKLLMTH
jgi:hypothetical protein